MHAEKEGLIKLIKFDEKRAFDYNQKCVQSYDEQNAQKSQDINKIQSIKDKIEELRDAELRLKIEMTKSYSDSHRRVENLISKDRDVIKILKKDQNLDRQRITQEKLQEARTINDKQFEPQTALAQTVANPSKKDMKTDQKIAGDKLKVAKEKAKAKKNKIKRETTRVNRRIHDITKTIKEKFKLADSSLKFLQKKGNQIKKEKSKEKCAESRLNHAQNVEKSNDDRLENRVTAISKKIKNYKKLAKDLSKDSNKKTLDPKDADQITKFESQEHSLEKSLNDYGHKSGKVNAAQIMHIFAKGKN